MGFRSLLLFFLFASATSVAIAKDFNVMQHAANPGGAADSTKAFMDTWKEACAFVGPERATVVVPKGIFLVGQVTFEGPCKVPVDFQILGTVRAFADPSKFPTPDWIIFQHLNGTSISGGGTFDGQGQQAWKLNDCNKNAKCKALPLNIRFNFLTDTYVSRITSSNSKSFNVNVFQCKNITLESFAVNNPGDSPNTDGIHIGDSSQVSILNSTIATGDDCVSVGPGSVDVKVIGVTCGPGHGISIGSLGRYANEADVTNVTVRNCTITKTMNGVRVKTWPKVPNVAKGKASTFIFEDIIMNDVQNPIIIDQLYCPYFKCGPMEPSPIAISDVSFNKIRGTTSTKTAISILCSKTVPCQGIKIGDVHLEYSGTDGPAIANVTFTNPILTGAQVPPIKAGAAGAAGAAPGAAPAAGAAPGAAPAAATPAAGAAAATPAAAAKPATPAGATPATPAGGAAAS